MGKIERALETPRYIKLNPRDNVAIVVNDFGLPAGSKFACGLTLRALLRRLNTLRPRVAQIADLTLDTASHAVTRAGKSLTLTAKEYALLEFLVLNQGRVVGREQIAQHVWDASFDPFSNVIDVYVKRLRDKLDAGYTPRLIHTRRGEGYILTPQAGAGDE